MNVFNKPEIAFFIKRNNKNQIGSMSKSKTFCVLPWKNITTNNNGKVKLCCNVQTENYIKNDRAEEGNIHKDSIASLWNSPHIKKIRRDMTSSKPVPDCQYCYDMEKQGGKSSRQWANERYLSRKVKQTVKLSLKNEGQVNELPDSLELRLSNYCNLKCHSCWSLSSSQLSSERQVWLKDNDMPEWLKKNWLFEKDRTNFPTIKTLPEGSLFMDSFRKLAPSLKRLYFSGGEPTLIKAYEAILEHLVQEGNIGLELSLTINLTKVSQRFLSLLKQFSNVEVSCSIDAYGKVNDYIRYPSRWKIISSNFEFLKKSLPKANTVIYSVYSIYNSFSLMDLCEWVEEFSAPSPICISWLRHPEYLRVENLPKNLKEDVLKKWSLFMKGRRFKNSLTLSNMKNLPHYLEKEPEDGEALFNRFLSYTKFADKKRNISLREYIPELGVLYE